MKLTKRVFIGAETVQLVSHHAVLELSMAGRAIIEVNAKQVAKNAIFALDIGYNEKMERWFTGVIAKVTETGTGSFKLVVREIAALLGSRWPVSIQHATMRQVLEALSESTGLAFVLPENVDYTDVTVANFTSQGTGYQLLNNLGSVFNVPDLIWYQQPDGRIFVGDFSHSRWASRPVVLPAKISSQQAGNCWEVPAMPAMRPGALVNNARVQKVELIGDSMTITWAKSLADRELEKRAVLNLFPELAGGYHLPRFGVVVGIADNAKAGDIASAFRPRYAVDVQLLNEHGKKDEAVPTYKAMPLPVMFSGPESGLLQYPLDGTIVELGFAYGRPDKAFIRTVLGQDWSLPAIEQGEQLQQQRAEVYQRTDSAGNQVRATDQHQQDKAWAKTDTAEQYTANYGTSTQNVAGISAEYVAGPKLIEALGAVDILAGDDLSLGSLGNMHLTTAGDLIEVVGKLRQAVIALDDKVTVLGDQNIKAKNITQDADTIKLNGGLPVVTCAHICHYTGKPHGDGSSTVTAGK